MYQFHKRPRRLRKNQALRDLTAETSVSAKDLIYPVFVHDSKDSVDIDSMPGQKRLCQSELLSKAENCLELGVPAMAIFPVVGTDQKSVDGSESYNDSGFLQETIRALKKRFPELTLISDVALDPYTTHGQDGIIDPDGNVLNDLTVETLARQALSQAAAGADIVAPSDMMDGRVGIIRKTLEENHYINTSILSYSAKYASSFYSPFREAVGSKNALANADKRTYQMDPRNSDEALREAQLDINEGADILMVKPGGPYLDIVSKLKSHFDLPVFVYQVSGEYSMIKAASLRGWIDEEKAVFESMIAFKRARADAILTYFALDFAAMLKRDGHE